MAELAYMIRKDWAQRGTGMVAQSAVIRGWLGEAPYLFAPQSVAKLAQDERHVDNEVIRFIAPDPSDYEVIDIAGLRDVKLLGTPFEVPVVVIQPRQETDLDLLRDLIASDQIFKLFVMAWSPSDRIRHWLDALQAIDLHTGRSARATDPLMVEGAKVMVREQYNGLNSGRGKDAIVQILQAFAARGYSLDEGAWMRAFFAAGGHFRHSDTPARLIREMKEGVSHRVKPGLRL